MCPQARQHEIPDARSRNLAFSRDHLIHYIGGAIVGIAGFLIAAAVGIVGAVSLGFAPMAADVAPLPFEANLAMRAVHAVSEREMGNRIYQHNCLICHGAADGKASNVARGFYVPAPQFALDGAEDDSEGASYWKIYHGIRFTAMPAFRDGLGKAQMWRVAMFLKHMDHLPRDVESAWKSTKSVGTSMSVASARRPTRECEQRSIRPTKELSVTL